MRNGKPYGLTHLVSTRTPPTVFRARPFALPLDELPIFPEIPFDPGARPLPLSAPFGMLSEGNEGPENDGSASSSRSSSYGEIETVSGTQYDICRNAHLLG